MNKSQFNLYSNATKEWKPNFLLFFALLREQDEDVSKMK